MAKYNCYSYSDAQDRTHGKCCLLLIIIITDKIAISCKIQQVLQTSLATVCSSEELLACKVQNKESTRHFTLIRRDKWWHICNRLL